MHDVDLWSQDEVLARGDNLEGLSKDEMWTKGDNLDCLCIEDQNEKNDFHDSKNPYNKGR